MPKGQLAGYMEGEIFHVECEWKTEINIFYLYSTTMNQFFFNENFIRMVWQNESLNEITEYK